MRIGHAIRLCRLQRDMSQSDLATKADISVSYLSLLEREKRDPVMSTLETLAKALSIPLTLLLFLASSDDELKWLDITLREKLSEVALRLMKG